MCSLSPKLPKPVREIAILVTGARYHSAYEIYAHVLVAELRGLPDDKINTIISGQRPGNLSRQEAIAYDARIGGRYRFHRDPDVLMSSLGTRYVGDMDRLFDTYAEMLPRMQDFYRERFPKSAALTAQASKGISDLQFTGSYRVPYQYSPYLRQHLKTGSFLQSSSGVTVTDLDGNEFFREMHQLEHEAVSLRLDGREMLTGFEPGGRCSIESMYAV